MSFVNKVVIVTGSSSGIGATTAMFAREGAKVTITAIVADISKEDDAIGIVNKTVSHFGKLDVLVNNAEVVSYRATMTYAAMPHLVTTKGNIVNVSSIAGVAPGTTSVSDEEVAAATKRMPLGFMTESEEVGELILYLASDKAKRDWAPTLSTSASL
ncbi:Granaticin polyketide synthase putative ketoacyl reductase 2 [Eumeta japonica]|uniref:Granaticin polyketide synthase putative ketoacyl reductase 2 n=1 Tax=Eumeta variegata TaxID=151549 RepID=A0A4C1SIN2_EUMVA|nr:Granaticin polyketide synthase putative ketoacyl reductase 2 [Eumeta japonica]